MKKVIAGKIKPQLRLDGYYNVLNKYGTQHDSTEYYQWATGAAVTDAELADLYAGNGLFSTIIDAPADDATKNGIDLGIKDKDLQKRLDDHLQTIHYQSKLAKALKWARLFGGSAVVMLVDDGRLLQDPLNWRDVHGVAELLLGICRYPRLRYIFCNKGWLVHIRRSLRTDRSFPYSLQSIYY